jgi:hypothetical protein
VVNTIKAQDFVEFDIHCCVFSYDSAGDDGVGGGKGSQLTDMFARQRVRDEVYIWLWHMSLTGKPLLPIVVV